MRLGTENPVFHSCLKKIFDAKGPPFGFSIFFLNVYGQASPITPEAGKKRLLFEFKKSVNLLRVPTHSATICIRFLNGQFSIVKLIEPFSGPYTV